ncbi:MAG: fibronectin-binding autotransporter adhesin, partial [Pseudonocardiales bacterium]|nr:fibronectin-binding autotransporter adhesin [Pseudonocardiales bacterium]
GTTFDMNGFSDTISSIAGAGSVTSSVAGAVTLTSGSVTSAYSGIASDGAGTLSLTKIGAGTLTLSGLNTYRGATTITAGAISIAVDANLGTGPASPTPGQLTFSGGGILTVTGTFTLNANRGIALAGAGTLSPGATLTYAGIVAGTGALTKAGIGTLVLSGANTYTGATVISAGTLSIAADSALGVAPGSATAGQLTFSAASTLLLSASLTLDPNRGIALNGPAIVSIASPNILTYGGIVAGASTLTKAGTGTLVLSGVNTYTGSTFLNGGVVSVTADSALGTPPGIATAGQLTFSSASTLLVGGSFTLNANRGIALTGGATFSINPGVTLSYGGIAAGASTLTKAGTGTLTLTGVNTYAGATTISSGVLVIAADSGLGVAPGAATPGKLTFSAAGTLQSSASLTLSANRGIALTGPATISTDAGTTLTYGGIVAGASTLTKTGPGTLILAGVNTYTGATTISSGTVSVAANSGLGTAPGAATPGNLALAGGTLQTTAGFTLGATRGIALGAGGGTFDVASGTTLVYGGIATGTGSVTKTGAGILDLGAATVTAGGVTISSGTLAGPNATAFSVTGAWTNDAAPSAYSGGTGTVTFNGSGAQAVGGSFGTTFNSFTIANAAGISLGADATVTGTLTFTTGKITTGASTIHLASGGTVSRISGHVVGNFEKSVATGAPSLTFEVGDSSIYAPVTVGFASVSVAGGLTVSTTAGEHPSIGTSTIDPTKSVNRFWTLTNNGIAFTSYSATFTFVTGDIDAGVDTQHLVIEDYSGSAWTPQATGTRTFTSTQATGIDTFGAFAIGELTGAAFDHFVVSAPATATSGTAFDVTVTSVDSAGNTLTGYTGTVTFSSSDDYGTFTSSSYTFLAGDNGTKTFSGLVTLIVAGNQTVSVSDSSSSGTSAPIAVGAGAFAKLLVLVPGQTADPGSPTGRTGSPDGQTVNAPFLVTVHAVDARWNVVATTDTVAITASDASAALPANAALVAGAGSFSITLESGGSATVTASDVTDVTKTAGVSSAIAVTDTAPTASDDAFSVTQDNTLEVAAAGVLANDADAESQPLLVATPRPISGPTHGTLTLDAVGSFTYTPDPGYVGPDSFTYAVVAGALTSVAATVTIDVTSAAFLSGSDWATTFDPSRSLSLTFPSYVPVGSTVTGATFRHSYRSATAGDTTCYSFEVYAGVTLLATHGSGGSPVSCNATSSFVTDTISLPEITAAAATGDVTIVLYVWNSGGHRSQHALATLGVDYSH